MTETVLEPIGHIGEGAIRRDRHARGGPAYRYRSYHRVGGRVDDRNGVGNPIGHIGEGAIRRDRHADGKTAYRYRSYHRVGGRVDD